MNFYDLKATDNQGNEVAMSEFRGKVVIVVNTATGCHFTKQYQGLQELYLKYKDQGLEILDFPCNQFGNQASGTDAEISEFCIGRFGVSFRQFAKVEVNGANASPLFTWLKQQQRSIFSNKIKWNFSKFLVDRQGNVVKRYAPTTTPQAIESAVKALLDEKAEA